ncbi:hypothetical protein FAEPRAA2165_00282 [Faecalibacterium duncaniae]|uniref:Uncharacterized protein n=1 Tax=Faecalibacterium duncaniae (strain DSM 17677 / JCM 31915 / A2-165) TaxID=411483 RepID=C7H1Z1_FAED2|nr:hypothetical protein FAEPRAA2165_00282 [Faecalibacterium duncaniae]
MDVTSLFKICFYLARHSASEGNTGKSVVSSIAYFRRQINTEKADSAPI